MTTQYATNAVEFRNVVLRSATDNATWYFRYAGSSQTLVGVEVKDSNAYQGSPLIADATSVDLGDNHNWAFGDARYWSAGVASNWNNTANWSRASGGTTGASVPTSTHSVVFDGANGKNGQANVDVAVNVGSLTISGYTNLLNTQGYNITVSSALVLGSGGITLTTNTISVGGDVIRSPGFAFNAGISTVTLTGAQNQSINFGTTTIFNLNVNKTGGTATLASALTSTGSLVVAGGTFDTSASNWNIVITSHVIITGGTFNLNASTMSVLRDWTNSSGAFVAGASTVNFIGSNTQTITSSGNHFYNVISSKTAAIALNVAGSLGVDGSWTQLNGTLNTQNNFIAIASSTVLTSGIWNLGTSSITVGGNFTRTGTTFNIGASTIAFIGGLNQTINPGSTSFFNIQINKSGGTATLAAALISTGTLTISGGTFDTGVGNWSVSVTSHVVINGGTFNLNNSTMSLQRDWTFSSGALNASGSTVTFSGSNTQNITSGGSSFSNFTINKNAGSIVLQDALDINGSIFTNTLGTFNTNTKAIAAGGNWNFTAGTYTGTGSTVTFNSPTQSALSGSTTFYALQAIMPNTTLYFTAGTTQYVTNQIDLENIALRSTANNAAWYFRFNGANQTVLNVDVKDSNANSANTIDADPFSSDLGNNSNWDFGNSKRYWVATSAGNWGNTANWSYVSGGAGGYSAPAAGQTAVFDGANSANGICLVDINVIVSTLTMSGYAGTFNTQSYNVTVSSSFSQSTGSVQLGTSVFTLSGNFIRNGGAFDDGSSTISFTGGQNQTLTCGTTEFENVVINKSGGTLTLTDNLFVDGNWIDTAGAFNAGTSTITFTGNGPRSVGSGGQSFYRVAFAGVGSWTLVDPFSTTGQLSITNGTLDTSASDWSLTAASDVVLNGGTLNLNASTMSVAGHWTKTAGAFNAGTSTVVFTGSSNQNINAGGGSFEHFTTNKTGGAITMTAALDVNGNFNTTLGTFNSAGISMNVAGNWSNSGTFTGTNSTVTFDGATAQTLAGPSTFYAMRAVIATDTLYFAAGATDYVTALLDMENISLRSTTNGLSWQFTYSGSSQTLLNVNVEDSNAWNGAVLLPDSASSDSGNNHNWAFGDQRYWVASAASNWNNTANWSRASGGTGGASVPTSTHTVVFDGANGKNGQANVDVAVNVASLTFSGYSGTFNTQGFAVSISSSLTLGSGTITLTTNTLSVGGDLLRSAGNAFNAGVSTITLTGAQAQSINIGTATIFNLFVNKTGGATATLASALTSTGSLTITGGTFDTSASNWSLTVTSNVVINGGTFNLNNSTMSVLRDWTETSGTLNADGSTVTFTGANATQNITLSGDNFFNITNNKSAGSVVLQDPFDADGSFTNTLGTFNTNSKSLSIGGNWNFAAGTYTGAGSTVTFNSPTQSTLSGATTFYAMRALTANTTLYFTAGTTQYITGSVDFENVTLRSTVDNSVWRFDYAGSSQTLLNLQVKDSNAALGATMVSPTSLSLGNNTNWTFAPTDVGVRYWIASAASNWNNAANWSISSGGVGGAQVPLSTHTVVFDGAGGKNGNCLVNTTVSVATLTISGYTGVFNTQSNNVTVSNTFSQNSGTVQLGTSVVTLQGDVTRTGGNFIAGTSTLSFTGSQSQALTPGATSFYHVVVNKSGGTLTLAGVMDINGNFTQSAGTFVTASNDIDIAGNWSKTGGTFDGTASTVTFNGAGTQTLTGSTTFYDLAAIPGLTLNFAAGTTQYISDGVNFQNVTLRSTTNNAAWYLEMDGANQTIANVDVKDSNATAGNTLLAGNTSTDSGNNHNWAFNDVRYWVASSPGNWNSPANWGYVSDGPGGASVPASTHTVIFDGANGDNGNCLVNTTVSVATLTISGYTGIFNTQSYNVTVSSSFTQSTGSVQLGTSTLTLQGDFIRTGGNFDDGTSTVSFTGGQNQNLTSGTTAFFHVTINKSGGTLTLADNLRVDGSWTNSGGTFNAGTSTVTFGASAARTIHSASQSFGNVVFNNTAGSWTLQDAMQISGALTMSNGTLNTSSNNYPMSIAGNTLLSSGTFSLNSSTVGVGGNFIISSTTFVVGASTVMFTGGSNQNIDAGGVSFFNVQINKSGGAATLASAFISTGSLTISGGTFDTGNNWSVTVASHVVINGGTFNLNNSTMSVQRDWLNTGGTFNPGASTVTFINANSTQNITSGGGSFFNLSVNKTGGTVMLQDALVMNGNFTLALGSFTTNSKSITAGGNWNRPAGAFIGTGSTVTFNNAVASTLSGSTTFYGLRSITSNAVLYFTAGATQYATNLIDLENISLLSTVNNSTWYFTYTGSSQTVTGVSVQDSNASAGTGILADLQSTDLGNNHNWAFGDKRYWVSAVASTWNTAANWSRISGGAGGASVPTSTHTVVFDGANGKNGQANINVAVNVGTLTISGYAGTFNTQGFPITVVGNLTQTSGVITLTTNTVSVGGDYLANATFNAGSSTITLTGALNQNINFGTATISNLFVNKTGGTATLASALTSTGSLTIAGGTFDTGVGNWSLLVTSHVVITGGTFDLESSTMSVLRNWTKTGGSFIAGTSTVNFTGSNAQIITTGGDHFYHVVSSKTTATTLAVGGALNIDGNWTHLNGTLNTQNNFISVGNSAVLTSGIWNLGTSSITIGGDFTRTGTTFNIGSSTVVFVGGINQTINPGATSFFNIQINKSGGTATLASALISTGTLTISGGTFDTGNNWSVAVTSYVVINGGTFNLNNSTMSVQRDWTISSGALNAAGSTVTFSGSNTQNITSDGTSFTNLLDQQKRRQRRSPRRARHQRNFHQHARELQHQRQSHLRRRKLEFHRRHIYRNRLDGHIQQSDVQHALRRHHVLRFASAHAQHHALFHRGHDAVCERNARLGKCLFAFDREQRDVVFHLQRLQPNVARRHRPRLQRQRRRSAVCPITPTPTAATITIGSSA